MLTTMQATRLRSRLAAVKEPVTDRHFTDIILQGLLESYRDIKLTTYDDFNLSKIPNHETLVPGPPFQRHPLNRTRILTTRLRS